MVMWESQLHVMEAGGETYFRRSEGCPPDILDRLMTEGGQQQPSLAAPSQVSSMASAGLRIKPKQGRAIMFWYTPPVETWHVASLGPGPAGDMAAK